MGGRPNESLSDGCLKNLASVNQVKARSGRYYVCQYRVIKTLTLAYHEVRI
jgi:hypothetical protein